MKGKLGMKDINAHIGARIRLYRKAKKLTLTALSGMIHKSKATISKYETGDIAIDVETLYDIALDVNIAQLMDYSPEPSKHSSQLGGFFPQERIYVYFYDGRTGKIVCNLLELNRTLSPCAAIFYLDVPSFDSLADCRSLYYGTAEYFDTVTNFSFANQTNRIEHVSLCAVNPFDRVEQVQGMLTGISRYPLLPVSIKCVLSPNMLALNKELEERLILSKRDMKLIKSLNMFAVEQE